MDCHRKHPKKTSFPSPFFPFKLFKKQTISEPSQLMPDGGHSQILYSPIILPMMSSLKKVEYKTYCFEHQGNIMFFYYNSDHPIMMKNLRFQLGRVKLYSGTNRLYTCHLWSTPHLNSTVDWNEEYFAKLFHGLALFELEGSGDQHDDTLSLIVKDHFVEDEEVFLMRANLTEEFGHDLMNQLWNTYAKFNAYKVKSIESSVQKNEELRAEADEELTKLIGLQESKEEEKRKLKGQMSALLREKEAKLRLFNQNFDYFSFAKESEPSLDMDARESITGSLFQQSQEFGYPF